MRFVSAHKLTSYMMVGCAVLALILSGELTLPVLIATIAAIVGSWWWEPSRVRIKRYAPFWAGASILVLAYTLLRVYAGTDLIIAGVDYLLFLLVAKLYNRNACRDYLHIYALTFFMLVAGTMLNPEISFGLCFFGYVISTTWALILFHLRREMEENFLLKHSDDRASEPVQVTRILNSRRIVGARFFAGTSLVSVSVFLVAVMMFLAIPRIGFGLFVQKRRSGLTMAGFSDGIQLGGHGTIKNDSTVIMRVKLDEGDRTARTRALYWRGVAFDEYQKGRWRRSARAPSTSRQITHPAPGVARHHLLYNRDQMPKVMPRAMLDARLERATRHEIYLEPIGYDVLFGASMPLAFEFSSGLRMQRPRTERNDEIRFEHGAGMKYTVYSDVARPDSDVLRAAPRELPPGYEQYLQVPEEIPARVTELAREITRDATTDYDKAEAVAAWLRDNLAYTLEMRSPGDMEPIDFFLFERRAGHCEYFSSAMAIMVRTLGIPARNVNGFLGGEWNEYDAYVAVRARDAHSWVEVYFQDVGWVTFDPTPSSSASFGEVDDGVSARMRRLLDTVRFQWFRWVIEYDLYQQLAMFDRASESVSGGTSSFKVYVAQARAWLLSHREHLGATVLACLLVVAAVMVRRRLGRRRQARAQQDPMSALYERVLARLARRGHGRLPEVTPREHARALAAAEVPGADILCQLTELYYASIYSGRGTSPEALAEAQALADAVEQAFRDADRSAASAHRRAAS